LKVFISSVITGFEEFREAAVAAIRSLRHTAIRAEDFSAKESSPQVACLAGVREADVVLVLLGERYGSPQESGLSATHEEYREARDQKPVLAFIQADAALEQSQAEFVREVQNWHFGLLVAFFCDPEGLRNEVTSALRDLELARAVSPFDEQEVLARALKAACDSTHTAHPTVVISCASGPRQSILRPGQLSDTLADELQQEAMFGVKGIFDRGSATSREIRNDWLWLRQDHAELGISQVGNIFLALPAVPMDHLHGGHFMAIIEEDVQSRIEQGLRFIAWALNKVDPLVRLSHCVVVVGLLNAEYLGWMTQAEADAHPNSVTVGSPKQSPPLVQLSPPQRRRQELMMKLTELTEDFIVLLRRELQA
jgi:hypothetical protein